MNSPVDLNYNQGLAGAGASGSIEIAEYMKERGAADWDEFMLMGISRGNEEVVRYAIEKGARDFNRGLGAAASYGLVYFARMMVNLGATNAPVYIQESSAPISRSMHLYLHDAQTKATEGIEATGGSVATEGIEI